MRKLFPYISLIMLGALLLPQPVYALEPFDIDTCAPGHDDWDYTVKIVDCVETSVKDTVIGMMTTLSTYMMPVVGGMLTLAVAIFGMRMMGGEQGMRQKMLGFALRVAFIMVFASNLGGYASSVFVIEDELVTIVSGGTTPWAIIDEFLGRLIGTGPPPIDISKGILGIVGASLLSTTAAGIMAFIALAALINILLFIFRAVFMYLTAIVMIGFLLAISPLVIPMALFVQHTERYFTKWLDILLSAMLTPVLMFAFLTIFLQGFTSMVDDVIEVLQCGTIDPDAALCSTAPEDLNFIAFRESNTPPDSSWLVPTDPSLATKWKNATGNPNVGTPAVQSNITPTLRRAQQVTPLTKSGTLNFGPEDAQIWQEFIATFLALWIFASFMKSLIERIPDLATNIAEASSHISMGPSQAEQTVGAGLRNVQTTITGRR